MRRTLLVPLVLAPVALAVAGNTPAASRAQPSDRTCLIAWNSPANDPNHVWLLAQRPISGLQLLPGTVATDTWPKGSTPTQTSRLACLLTLAKPGQVRIVTGFWKTGGGVSRWSFGRTIPTRRPIAANVRLLPDGRVTKIYRR